MQELLDAAFLSKNSLSVHSGASPFQLMSDLAPHLSAALMDGRPALGAGPVEDNDALRTSLSLLHAAWVAHAQAEAEGSLRRVLARYATNVPSCVWAVGDVVYSRAEGFNFYHGLWRGPAHVMDMAVAKDLARLQHGNRSVFQSGIWVRLVADTAPPAPLTLLEADATASGSSNASYASDGVAHLVDSVPAADTSASILACARYALRRDGSPPPPLPACSAWTGRTRGRGSSRVRVSAGQAAALFGASPGTAADSVDYGHGLRSF